MIVYYCGHRNDLINSIYRPLEDLLFTPSMITGDSFVPAGPGVSSYCGECACFHVDMFSHLRINRFSVIILLIGNETKFNSG